jgi:ribonuclease P protein component
VSQKFPFSKRLHRPEEFERVLRNKAITDKWLALHSTENTIGSNRLGIIVSKRVVAKSVARNRIKRAIREVFRQSPLVEINALDFVVRLRRNLREEETMEFRRSLSRLLMKVRITKDDAPVLIPDKRLPVPD